MKAFGFHSFLLSDLFVEIRAIMLFFQLSGWLVVIEPVKFSRRPVNSRVRYLLVRVPLYFGFFFFPPCSCLCLFPFSCPVADASRARRERERHGDFGLELYLAVLGGFGGRPSGALLGFVVHFVSPPYCFSLSVASLPFLFLILIHC